MVIKKIEIMKNNRWLKVARDEELHRWKIT